jgi:glycosyltransferase involved in cell wall biosynthesis
VGLIKAYDMLRAKGQEFSDLRLVLAGAPGWSNKRLYRAWRQSPYQSDIIFLGYISQKEKEILYSRASVFVYPSFYEGFGFPPLEALSYGLPVVCSNVSSLPEVVGLAALMIDPYQPGEIAAAIQEILTHDDLRNSLIEQGRQIAANFSWEKTARAYQDIFNKL